MNEDETLLSLDQNSVDESVWKKSLLYLKEKLQDKLDVEFDEKYISIFPGEYASCYLRSIPFTPLNLVLGGFLMLQYFEGELSIYSELLLFSEGNRLCSLNDSSESIIFTHYDTNDKGGDWEQLCWRIDDYSEWARYVSLDVWDQE